MNNKPTKGIQLILLSTICFGSYGVWSRLMGDSFGPFFQGWSRSLIICLLLLPLLLKNKEIIPFKKEDRKWLGVFLVFTSLTQAPIYYAFNHMDIGTVTVLFFGTMLLTMYSVGFGYLGEKLTKVKIVAFLMAIIGLAISFSFSLQAFSLLAASMAVLNGIASGGEVSFSKKLSGNYSALYLTWLSWLIILITNLPISLILGETQHLPSFSLVWIYQIGYVAAGMIAFWAIIEGLKYVEASIGGLLGLLEIVFSILFGMLIFNEGPTLRSTLGAMLVFAAAALPHITDLRSTKK